MQQDREIKYDILRILSMFAVILLHVNATYFDVKGEISFIWEIENAINYFTRFAVPCFVMISGAFMLNKKKGILSIYVSAIYKILIPFLYMTAMWVVIMIYQCIKGADFVGDLLLPILCGNYGALWFIPMQLGLYLLTPVYMAVIEYLGEKKYFFVGVLLVWSIISQVLTKSNASYTIGVVGCFSSYYLLGGVLYSYIPKEYNRTRYIILLLLISVIVLIIRSLGFRLYMIDPYVSHFSPGVVVFSIIVFMLFKQSQIKYAPKIISRISKNSLYIYMIHRIIVIVVTKILDSAVENELLKIVMAFIMTFILSWLIAEIWIEIRDTLNQKYQIKQRISDYLCNKYSLQ